MKERIKKVIKEKLKFNSIDIKNDDHIKETLGLDSLDLLALVIGIEKEFNIKIDDAEVNAKNFYSLNSLEKFIQSKQL